MVIGIKYNSWEVLGLIATQGSGGIDPGDPYLSSFPNTYFDDYIHTNARPHMIGRYFNAYNLIGNYNRMQ